MDDRVVAPDADPWTEEISGPTNLLDCLFLVYDGFLESARVGIDGVLENEGKPEAPDFGKVLQEGTDVLCPEHNAVHLLRF